YPVTSEQAKKIKLHEVINETIFANANHRQAIE
ncbi:DNA primase, partial [Escherichia coli]|nr:DNA primase [Escherichia coli]